ncbi:hypothetical protein [Paraflavitalea pollutisoli]|uniref:hypothetical protein n=1 Tax=Paraflavitalea pollutisoli TaxID=3034143 RepID=UPI0023ED633F|nr:hypothetical protein [Paraflavitalea sp. H1-2-19X]
MRNLRLAGVALLLAFSFVFQGCKKELRQPDARELFTTSEARQYFEQEYGEPVPSALSNSRSSQLLSPDWTLAETRQSESGTAIIVPVRHKVGSYVFSRSSKYYFPLDSITKLYIYKTKEKGLQAAKITYLPDDDYIEKGEAYSGLVVVEDWNGPKRVVYQKLPSGELLVSTPEKDQTSNTRMECVYFYGHNYSEDDPEGYYYTELIGCYFVPDPYVSQPIQYDKVVDPLNPGGGGVGKPTFGASSAVVVLSGTHPIPNAKAYLNCFSNLPGNTNQYQVSIAVAQPIPGTRETWTFVVPSVDDLRVVNVGHTFLILSQTGPNGAIVRNVGFYPKSLSTPRSPISPGVLNNDQYKKFNIRLNITMTGDQFMTVMDYITQNEFSQYNINNYNCTNFALNALAYAGINVYTTVGTWPGGQGYNPGYLGEDIRGMTPTTTMKPSNSIAPHPNKGFCQ